MKVAFREVNIRKILRGMPMKNKKNIFTEIRFVLEDKWKKYL